MTRTNPPRNPPTKVLRTPPSRKQYVSPVIAVVVVVAAYVVLVVVNGRSTTGTVRPGALPGPARSLYVSPSGSRHRRRQKREGSPLQHHRGRAREGHPRHGDQPGSRDLPGTAHHRPRRRPRRTDHHQGARERQGPGGPLSGRGVRHRARVQHRPQLLHPRRVHHRRTGEAVRHVLFPDDIRGHGRVQGQRPGPRVEDGRLVYVGAAEETRDLTGITITNMFLNGAGGECVRLRNNAHDNTVSDSVIQYCGLFGKGDDDERATYHNGEGVYIGTSPGSDDQPMHDNDTSSHNVVTRNIIQHVRVGVLQHQGERARQRVRGQRVQRQRRVRASSRAATSSCAATPTSCATTRSRTAPATPSRSRTTATSTTSGGNVVENNRLSGAAGATFKIKAGGGAGADVRQPGGLGRPATVDGEFSGDLTGPCGPS